VNDSLTFNQVIGNVHTGPQNSSVVFGWVWFLIPDSMNNDWKFEIIFIS
jgi:hypothetical protein